MTYRVYNSFFNVVFAIVGIIGVFVSLVVASKTTHFVGGLVSSLASGVVFLASYFNDAVHNVPAEYRDWNTAARLPLGYRTCPTFFQNGCPDSNGVFPSAYDVAGYDHSAAVAEKVAERNALLTPPIGAYSVPSGNGLL